MSSTSPAPIWARPPSCWRASTADLPDGKRSAERFRPAAVPRRTATGPSVYRAAGTDGKEWGRGVGLEAIGGRWICASGDVSAVDRVWRGQLR